MSSEKKEPKFRKIVSAADQLSLGISMVVAVILGVGIGIWLKSMFGYEWLLWLGVFWGVAAAGLNVYKSYEKQKRELDKLKDDPKYKNYKDYKDEDDEKY